MDKIKKPKASATVPLSVECTPRKARRYKGLRQPSCNQGKGCNYCWSIYNSEEAVHERLYRRVNGNNKQIDLFSFLTQG